uniref:C-type lectin domain-containing protein n=1 Tax=Labrus bergylta TaxID=56723 RepID=A0A3Q3FLJ6_9LABR
MLSKLLYVETPSALATLLQPMKSTIFFVFICAAVDGSGKHNFFPQNMTWFEAQAYCREHHTDLSFVSSEREQKMLQTAAGERFLLGWIGLHRDAVNRSVWKWSGGGDSTYFNWMCFPASGRLHVESRFVQLSRYTHSHGHPSKWRPF